MRTLWIAPAAYPLGGVADWLDYVLAGLSTEARPCPLALVEGGGHDPARYLVRHPWPAVIRVANRTGSLEGRIRSMAAAIKDSAADLVVCVNLVDVYEAVRRLRSQSAHQSPRVVMALHGLQANLIADIRREADVLDGVVATNRLSAALAAEAIGDASRVHYAPYGVPLPQPAAGEASSHGRIRLLFAGRIEQEQKRVLDLPPILLRLQESGIDAQLSIAGGGPLEEELRRDLEKSNLADSVHWLGDLDPPRLAKAYQTHDALLITSVWETGPIVAWEAMSHGLPVVSSRYIGSGLEGALVDGRTALLFEIGDIDGAAAAITRLLDSSAREALVSGGLALIRERYSREASVAAWDSALRAIMSAPRNPATSPRPSKPSGRLDRWLGVERAEDVRRLLGLRFIPDSPGAAWPHSGGIVGCDDVFFDSLRTADRRSAVTTRTAVT